MMTSNRKMTTRRAITTSSMMATGRVKLKPTVPLHARTDRSSEVAIRTIKMPGAEENSLKLAMRMPLIEPAFESGDGLATAK
jgi:hypothetical protein